MTASPNSDTYYPTCMKKTSIYLDDADVERLRWLADREGRSQAEIVRAAIASYEARLRTDREFSLTASWNGDGTSVAGVPEDELLEGSG